MFKFKDGKIILNKKLLLEELDEAIYRMKTISDIAFMAKSLQNQYWDQRKIELNCLDPLASSLLKRKKQLKKASKLYFFALARKQKK